MSATYSDATSVAVRAKRGSGSLRQRGPSVWEVRVVVGFDVHAGRSIQRSFTVHGDALRADQARGELVAEYASVRCDIARSASVVTVGELLDGYIGGAQLWRPATVASHRHIVATLFRIRCAGSGCSRSRRQ